VVERSQGRDEWCSGSERARAALRRAHRRLLEALRSVAATEVPSLDDRPFDNKAHEDLLDLTLVLTENRWARDWVWSSWNALWVRVLAAGAEPDVRGLAVQRAGAVTARMHALFQQFLALSELTDEDKERVGVQVAHVLREAQPYRERVPAYFAWLATELERKWSVRLHGGQRDVAVLVTWAAKEHPSATTNDELYVLWPRCPHLAGHKRPTRPTFRRYRSHFRKLEGMLSTPETHEHGA